jgi:hypothetical protein
LVVVVCCVTGELPGADVGTVNVGAPAVLPAVEPPPPQPAAPIIRARTLAITGADLGVFERGPFSRGCRNT